MALNLLLLFLDFMDTFIGNLKTSYRSKTLKIPIAAGPIKQVDFVNLALVSKKGLGSEKPKEQFIRNSLHGDVDDIRMNKKRINFRAIFKYGGDSRKLILVEGSPGIGKTRLALKLCKDWANNDILTQYEIVLLIPLRFFQSRESLDISDLVNIYSQGINTDEICRYINKNGGKNVLFILEGWDELSPNLRGMNSIFIKIISAFIFGNASVLVTSRPSLSGQLHDYMQERHIEVLGFSRKDIKEYVCRVVQDDEAKALLAHLERFPNLQAMAHIPLTLSIMCSVVKKTGSLPHTLTELYYKYISEVLLVDKKKAGYQSGFMNLSDIGVVSELCKMAFENFRLKKYTFTESDLAFRGRTDGSDCSLSLLTTDYIPGSAGCVKVYQFTHLSIQEFLAAYHMKDLLLEEQLSLLEKHRKDKQFQNLWRFYSGITKLKNESVRDKILLDTRESNESELFLIHCLYEANDPRACSVAAEKLKSVLNLNNKLLNPADCLCAAYVVSTGGNWTLDLRGCNIGDEGLKTFRDYFSKVKDDSFSIAFLK